MPKIYSYHSSAAAPPRTFVGVRAPRGRVHVLSLALVLSLCFTGPVMYMLGVSCRVSPRAVAAAVRVLEARRGAGALGAFSDRSASTPTASGTPTPTPLRRKPHKYDALNDLRPGDDPGSGFFVDVDNDILMNGSLANANASASLDEAGMVRGVTIGSRADWLTVHAYHRFCETMFARPVAAPVPLCTRGPAMECTDGSMRNETPFFARDGQDYYLHATHFSALKRTGVYMDIGTRHPVMGSPTYFFDACLRWRGVCVDAAPDVFQYIHRQRSCELVPTCIAARDNVRATFVAKPPHGGLLGHAHLHRSLRNKTAAQGVTKTRLVCTNAAALARRSNTKLVDLVTVSVDGQELDVLHGFDFDATLVNVFVVAVSNATLPHIQQLLAKEGYVQHRPTAPIVNGSATALPPGLLRDDAIFVHHDVIWGKPV